MSSSRLWRGSLRTAGLDEYGPTGAAGAARSGSRRASLLAFVGALRGSYKGGFASGVLRSRAGGEPLKTGSPCSVHAAVAPFLRSITVSVPAAIARSPRRRKADQNAVLHRARQHR